ncbi:nitrogenase component 1 [uncultured Methanocorpusculum sp.]|nr:nitrogenase component 1 [uncultured Methanocorpusculum sp.]
MGILDTVRDAVVSNPLASALATGAAASNPVTGSIVASAKAAEAISSVLSGGSSSPTTKTQKSAASTSSTPTPATSPGYTQNVDGTEITVNKVYDTVDGIKFVNSGGTIDKNGNYLPGSYASGSGYVATSRELDAEEKLATAYQYNHWSETSAGGGTGLSLSKALKAATAGSVFATATPAAATLEKDAATTPTFDLVGGLSTLAGIHPLGQLYTAITNLGGSGGGGITIPSLDEIKKDNPVSNMISGVISTRDAAYDSGGLAFVPAAAADILLPLDLVNTGNKLFTGETVTTEDWIYAGIDALTLAGGALSLGAGYVPLRGLAKGLKVGGKLLNVSGILGSVGLLFGGLGSEDSEGDGDKSTNPTLITDPDTNNGDGYWYTLRCVVEQLSLPPELMVPHDKVNIIVPITFSPADIREMKRTLNAMGVSYTILPDISETMDRPYETTYDKMPSGGTSVEAIRSMGGAKATIEFGSPGDERKFPGKFLEEKFGVPYYRIASPIGLEHTDEFFALLKTITGKSMAPETFSEHGRLMDAMIDCHKHAFAGRCTLFGDADLTYALAGFTSEIGMYPKVIASDSRNKHWKDAVAAITADNVEPAIIFSDTDFGTVRRESETAGSNIAIGHSDGKYLEEHSGIPLVRLGFPIHDRIGGQRICSTLYAGTNRLLDTCVNTLLERKYSTYRKRMYDQYFPQIQR